MKKALFILLLVFSYSVYGQKVTKFRLNNKQKTELLRNGDSSITMIEMCLNENESSLAKDKHPALNDPTAHIETARKKASTKSLSKIYKDNCLNCYEVEYKDQKQRLENHGLTDTNGFNVTIMPLFFNQDSVSIRKTFELILSSAKNQYSFDGVKYSQNQYNFQFFDESTRGTGNPRYIYFYTNKNNTGNKDLEIEGEDLYTFSIVYGKFLDFANFWINNINPNITMEKLSEKGSDEYTYKLGGENRTIRIKKDSSRSIDNWYIRNY